MRICLVVRALPVHRTGGLEYHTLDLARAMAAQGHDITVVTSRHPAGLASEEDIGDGVEVRYLAGGRSGDYSLNFFQNAGRLVSELDARRPFDIVHAQEFAGLFLGSLPGRLICTIHGTMFTEIPLDRRYFCELSPPQKLAAIWRYRHRLLLHPAFASMLKRADRLIVDSEFTYRELVTKRPGLARKLTVIPLGIDFVRYRPDARSEREAAARPLTIALLGRLQRMKGLLIAVDAARLLTQRAMDFRMLIGGKGEYAGKLAHLIDERNVQDYVKMCGPVPPDGISEFLGRADLFLFPDLTQPAFGLVAVEALLHGLPVVAARSGAIPEVVNEEVGWLYDSWNVTDLALILERIITRRHLVTDKAGACRRRAEKFGAERMARDTLAVYESLAVGKSP